MFLNPLNVRCLMRQYGSLEASPDSITGTVVEVVGQTVTEVGQPSPPFFFFFFLLLCVLTHILNYDFFLLSFAGGSSSESLSGSSAAHVRVQYL